VAGRRSPAGGTADEERRAPQIVIAITHRNGVDFEWRVSRTCQCARVLLDKAAPRQRFHQCFRLATSAREDVSQRKLASVPMQQLACRLVGEGTLPRCIDVNDRLVAIASSWQDSASVGRGRWRSFHNARYAGVTRSQYCRAAALRERQGSHPRPALHVCEEEPPALRVEQKETPLPAQGQQLQ
jgi:hypothetical protein